MSHTAETDVRQQKNYFFKEWRCVMKKKYFEPEIQKISCEADVILASSADKAVEDFYETDGWNDSWQKN